MLPRENMRGREAASKFSQKPKSLALLGWLLDAPAGAVVRGNKKNAGVTPDGVVGLPAKNHGRHSACGGHAVLCALASVFVKSDGVGRKRNVRPTLPRGYMRGRNLPPMRALRFVQCLPYTDPKRKASAARGIHKEPEEEKCPEPKNLWTATPLLRM